MHWSRRTAVIAISILAVTAGGVGAAVAAGGGDDDSQATGSGADRARAAALKATRGGTVNAVERESEDGEAWEVEVTKADGRTVDVSLDENYKRLAVSPEDEDTDQHEREPNRDDGGEASDDSR